MSQALVNTQVDDHLDGFQEFFQHLNQAARAVLPKVSRLYASVHVLLLRWEDDDLNTELELKDLDDLFRNVYHYDTERYLIPSHDPANALESKLFEFKRAHDDPSGTNLLIVYYGGHGCVTRDRWQLQRSVWQSTRHGGASLVWSELQGIMERARSDVVFILDCCFAASASRSPPGSKEGLWACNSAVTTIGVSNNSFTRNLIEELKVLHDKRFNIAMLHTKLMRRFKKPGPHKLLTEPWYSYLGDAVSPSAVLAPQDPPTAASSVQIDANLTETLILLAVRLRDNERVPDISTWQEWCHQLAPNDVGSVHALGKVQWRELIRLEGHFQSNSTLALVSLPIFLWDRLPKHAAYNVVDFVRSRNHAVALPSNQALVSQSDALQQKLHIAERRTPPEISFKNFESRLLELLDDAIPQPESTHLADFGDSYSLAKWVVSLLPKIDVASPQLRWASLLHKTAWFLWLHGETPHAGSSISTAMDIRNKLLGSSDPLTLSSRMLSGIISAARDLGSAQHTLAGVLDGMKAALDVIDRDRLCCIEAYGAVLLMQSKHAEARALYEHWQRRLEKDLGRNHPDVLRVISSYTLALFVSKNYDKAIIHCMAARRRLKSYSTDVPVEWIMIRLSATLAMILMMKHQYRAARDAAVHGLTIVEQRSQVETRKKPITSAADDSHASFQERDVRIRRAFEQALHYLERTLRLENSGVQPPSRQYTYPKWQHGVSETESAARRAVQTLEIVVFEHDGMSTAFFARLYRQTHHGISYDV